MLVSKRNDRANRFLNRMQTRIMFYIFTGQYSKALFVMQSIIGRSRSLQIMFFNRVAKGWYFNLRFSQVRRILNRLRNKSVYLPDKIESHRVYIPKSDGKMRPIRVPEISDRILNLMWTDFLYMLFYKDSNKFQHGFRRGKGIWTGWKEIIKI